MLNSLKFLISNNSFKQSWLILLLQQKLNVEVAEELQPVFNLSVAFLILNLVLLGAIFNLVCTIIVLYYKDKLELEIRFQNKPWILKLIKFYEKTSYVSIIYESILILVIILLMIGLTTFGIITILKN